MPAFGPVEASNVTPSPPLLLRCAGAYTTARRILLGGGSVNAEKGWRAGNRGNERENGFRFDSIRSCTADEMRMQERDGESTDEFNHGAPEYIGL